jgi:hypothetical protein
MKGLMLHCGAQETTRDDVENCPTPDATVSHHPIAHAKLLTATEACLADYGFQTMTGTYGMTHEGNRFFGLLDLYNGDKDFGLTVGVRNSHDKSFTAGLVAGSRVFVCDNLCFSGEIRLARKHTRWINRDLPNLMGRMIGRLGAHFNKQESQIGLYKDHELSEDRARWLIVEGMKRGVYGATQVPKILAEWEDPSHEEFKDPTMWRYFNAVTEVAKGWSTPQIMARTPLLHGICDMEAGFSVSA